MKLIDLLGVLDENATVSVIGENCVEFYDGRDSISEKYNNCTVLKVCAVDEGFITVFINE